MSCGRGRGSTTLRGTEWQSTLLGRLGSTVDRFRDRHTRFGARPYTVRIVKTRWTGGKRGRGAEVVVSTMTISPTPLISDMDSLTEMLSAVGTNESGGLQISEISPRYTEEELRGIDSNGTPVGPDENIYWEVEMMRMRDGLPGQKRRFQLRSAPAFRPYKFQWVVNLEKANDDAPRTPY